MSPARGSLPRLLPRPLGEEERRPEAPPSRRRKLVSNACNSCRTRKTKCDSARPQCRQCARRNWPCVYAAPPGVTSQQLKRERTENYASVVDLIRRGDGVNAEQIAQRIRAAESVDTAIGDIAGASLLLQSSSRAVAAAGPPLRQYPAAASRPLLTSPYEDCDFLFEKRYDTDASYRRVDPSLFVDVPGHDLPLSNWTSVSTDDRRMNHLLNLFFTWDNTVERIIYRPILEENVRRLRRGHQGDNGDNTDSDFCSPFLVNSLLALSCLYSMDPATYKDPADPRTRGRLWAEEAELHLQNCSRPSIALMQGLFIFLVYEGSLGDGTRTLQYLTRCMDVYRILNDRNMDELAGDRVPESRRRLEREAFSWCMWGMYCLEWRSTEALGIGKMSRRPKIDKVWREGSFTLGQANSAGYCWYPYPLSLEMQPSVQVALREADAALSEIVESILNYLHPGEKGIDAVSKPGYALELYDALLTWKYGLPDELRFEQSVLPSVIALHIHLETVSMNLLRPFAHLTRHEFGGRFSPRERCAAHASHLVSTAWSFRAHGQVRYEYYLSYALGAAAYILMQEPDAPVQMDSLVRACQCLFEMRPTLPLAADALSGIRAAFRLYRLALPMYMVKFFDRVRHSEAGALHHTVAVAGMLPAAGGHDNEAKRAELQLEHLLRDFGTVDIH
ncbi:hypothetical protein ARSEF4850_008606 [Beauveria asiatica]